MERFGNLVSAIRLKILILLSMSVTACFNSNIATDPIAFTPLGKLVVSQSNSDETQKLNTVNLEINDSVSVYSLLKKNGNYSNVDASWTLSGDVGNLTILSGGKGAKFDATKSGTGSVKVVSQGETATLNIIVADNASPVAVNDDFVVEVNTSGNILNLLANDTDADGDSLSISSITYSGSTTLTDLGDGSVQIDTGSSYYGKETFTYEITDGKSDPVIGTVTLRIATQFSWIGGSGNAFSSLTNWCGSIADFECKKDLSSPPGSSDIVIFSDICDSDCDVNFDTNVDVLGVRIRSNYTGTIDQSSSSVNLGSSGWAQSNGSFLGGSQSFVSAGSIDILGGSFTATSGSTRLSSPNTEIELGSSASFSHNNGLLRLYPSTGTSCGTSHITINTAGVLNLNELFIRFDDNGCNGYTQARYRVIGSGSVNVESTFTVDSGYFDSGSINIKDNVVLTCDSSNKCAQGGEGKLVFNGGKDQTYTVVNGASIPKIELNNPGFNLSPAGGTTHVGNSGITVIDGDFIGPTGNLNLWSTVRKMDILQTGGSLDLTNTTLSFSATNTAGQCDKTLSNLSGTSRLNLAGLRINMIDLGCNGYDDLGVNIGSNGVSVSGSLLLEAGVLEGGEVQVQGGIEFQCAATNDCAQGGNIDIRANGTGVQTFTQAANAKMPTGNFILDKTAGELRMSTNLSFRGAGSGHNLNLIQGWFSTYGFNLTGVDGYQDNSPSSTFNKSTGSLYYNYCMGTCSLASD